MITIEGRNPVLESLRAGKNLTDVYIKEGIVVDDKIGEIINLSKQLKVRYKFVSKRFLDNLSQCMTYQGVIGVRNEKVKKSFSELLNEFQNSNVQPFIVYIREAQNEFNVGSIVRSAEGAGANLVILPPKTHLTPQMVRASMGASEHLEIINEGLFQAIKTCNKEGIKVVGIELVGAKYYYETDLTGPIMLIIGGEDRSLSDEVLNKCDFTVKIPQNGKVNSLNMGVATAILLYEKVRQEA